MSIRYLPYFTEIKTPERILPKRRICGIYKITHKQTGIFYIGKSKNAERRILEHKGKIGKRSWSYLNKLVSISTNLGFHKISLGKLDFDYEIIETCKENELSKREVEIINDLQPQLNVHIPNPNKIRFSEEIELLSEKLNLALVTINKLENKLNKSVSENKNLKVN